MVATTGPSSADPLFTPWSIGNVELKHRIVLAPLTRVRADENTLDPNDMMVEYYEQRASDGGLLITEATYPFKEAGGIPTAPGCFTDEQIAGWKKINNAIHAKGGKVFVQFWVLGRANPGQSDVEVISASAIPIPTKEGEPPKPTPRALTTEEVQEFVKKFADGCKKAVEAGFDGVEIHGAHGYLVDQFFQSSSNTRTDQYGGSIPNRARFGLELIEASARAIGQEKLGIRLSPYGHFQGSSGGQLEVFTYLINEITERFPNFGYIHMVESRGDPSKLNNWEAVSGDSEAHETLDAFREIVKNGKGKIEFLSAGGYSPETARETVEKYGGGVVFGRIFISNPDLPERIKNGYPLAKYDRPTFYTRGPKGYTDYPEWSQPPTPTSTD